MARDRTAGKTKQIHICIIALARVLQIFVCTLPGIVQMALNLKFIIQTFNQIVVVSMVNLQLGLGKSRRRAEGHSDECCRGCQTT